MIDADGDGDGHGYRIGNCTCHVIDVMVDGDAK